MGGSSITTVTVLLKMHLANLDAFLKQKDGLSKEEIELIADEVMSQYGYIITFADINVIFRNAKLGRYGELYNRLSCSAVIKWFDQYVGLRCETAYEMNRQADRERYGQKALTNEQMKQLFGYEIDKDGKLTVNMETVQKRHEQQKAEEERKRAEKQAKIEKDNDYFRWRMEYEKNGTL